MKIVYLDLDGPPIERETALVVGNFDGVHVGHQRLIASVVHEARGRRLLSCALTFDPHPAHVVTKGAAHQRLMSTAEKTECLAALGLELHFVLRFTSEIAGWPPEEFARRIMRDRLRARVVTVGERFRFGERRAGNTATLMKLGRELGFEVIRQPEVLSEGAIVSSTRIRELVLNGEVDAASRLLGRRYATEGVVVKGEGRGSRMGYATANLTPAQEITPAVGVYAAWSRLQGEAGAWGRPWKTVVNVGWRPTFGQSTLLIEAHILEFSGDIYGRRLRIEYQTRLRDEIRFETMDALREQIGRDRALAEAVLVNGPGKGYISPRIQKEDGVPE